MLTGTGARFFAGLGLGEHFPLFAGHPAAVVSWFGDYRATNMRLFTYPRPAAAAVNRPRDSRDDTGNKQKPIPRSGR